MPIYMKYDGLPESMAISPIDKHAVSSFLMNNGVSMIGAQQFAAGDYVNDPQDRKLLANLLAQMVQGPITASNRKAIWKCSI